MVAGLRFAVAHSSNEITLMRTPDASLGLIHRRDGLVLRIWGNGDADDAARLIEALRTAVAAEKIGGQLSRASSPARTAGHSAAVTE